MTAGENFMTNARNPRPTYLYLGRYWVVGIDTWQAGTKCSMWTIVPWIYLCTRRYIQCTSTFPFWTWNHPYVWIKSAILHCTAEGNLIQRLYKLYISKILYALPKTSLIKKRESCRILLCQSLNWWWYKKIWKTYRKSLFWALLMYVL